MGQVSDGMGNTRRGTLYREYGPEIQEKILDIVSNKTGYPKDMLDLDLDLEADLGIDTVKQAETFSEIRAAFNIPKQDDLKLSDYPTLAHVIRFALDKSDLAQAGQASAPQPAQTASPSQASPLEPQKNQ